MMRPPWPEFVRASCAGLRYDWHVVTPCAVGSPLSTDGAFRLRSLRFGEQLLQRGTCNQPAAANLCGLEFVFGDEFVKRPARDAQDVRSLVDPVCESLRMRKSSLASGNCVVVRFHVRMIAHRGKTSRDTLRRYFVLALWTRFLNLSPAEPLRSVLSVFSAGSSRPMMSQASSGLTPWRHRSSTM